MNTRPYSAALLVSCIMFVAACSSTNAPASSSVSAAQSAAHEPTNPVQVSPSKIVGNGLTLSLFNAPPRRLNIPLPVAAPAGGWTWPPSSVTLISGERDAILVDTVPTLEDTQKLGDWIEASGKNLTTIYITHGHIDHFLGTAALLQRFPHARVVATEGTVRLIEEEAASGVERATYTPIFADPIASTVIVPEVLTGNRLSLEGHEIIAVPTGQSDVANSSYLYVPDLSTVMVGDIAYNGVHATLVTSTHETRLKWIQTLTEIQALNPRFVIAAHRDPTRLNDATILGETITYLQDADRLLAQHPTAPQFIAQMRAAHPDLLNLTTLIYSTAMQRLPQQ